MTVAWLGYSLVLSLFVGSFALALERLLRRWDAATRWIWTSAVTVSGFSPLLPLVWTGDLLEVHAHPSYWLSDLLGLPIEELLLRLTQLLFLADFVLPDLKTILLLGSGAAGLLVLGWIIYSWRDLKSREACWREDYFLGRRCYVSRNTGPGLVGVLRPRLVIPEWLMDFDRDQQELVAAHEAEHQHKRDPWLKVMGYASLVVSPWNPVVWWQVRRLALSIEIDCDRRVVSEWESRKRYGKTLLAVAENRSRWVTAFAEGEPYLTKRIKQLTRPSRQHWGKNLVAGVGLLAATLVLLNTPVPTSTPPRPDEVETYNDLEKYTTPAGAPKECFNCDEQKFALKKHGNLASRDRLAALVYVDESGHGRGAVCRPICSRNQQRKLSRQARALRYKPVTIWGVPVPLWVGVPVELHEAE